MLKKFFFSSLGVLFITTLSLAHGCNHYHHYDHWHNKNCKYHFHNCKDKHSQNNHCKWYKCNKECFKNRYGKDNLFLKEK